MTSVKRKALRLTEFLTALAALPAARTATEAMEQIAVTLNEVEDRLSGVPYDPTAWMNDGRMYPPKQNAARPVPGKPALTRYRSRQHNTFVGTNGAIRIEDVLSGKVLINKPGHNGLHVDDL